MSARIKDLGLGLMTMSWLVAAVVLSPAGPSDEALAAPTGQVLPTMCWIHAATGHECPTCGMSRSFVAFFHGDVRHAFRFHPMGPVLALASIVALLSVMALAISGREPLWGRPIFVRGSTLVTVAVLVAGVVRMFGALG